MLSVAASPCVAVGSAENASAERGKALVGERWPGLRPGDVGGEASPRAAGGALPGLLAVPRLTRTCSGCTYVRRAAGGRERARGIWEDTRAGKGSRARQRSRSAVGTAGRARAAGGAWRPGIVVDADALAIVEMQKRSRWHRRRGARASAHSPPNTGGVACRSRSCRLARKRAALHSRFARECSSGSPPAREAVSSRASPASAARPLRPRRSPLAGRQILCQHGQSRELVPLGGSSRLGRRSMTVAPCDASRVRRVLEAWVQGLSKRTAVRRRLLLIARRSNAVAQRPVARGRAARRRRLLNRQADAAVLRSRSGGWC